MGKIFRSFFLFILAGFTALTYAEPSHSVAITIDDLPFVGEQKNFHLNMIIDTIKAKNIPVTGFVIAGDVRPDNWPTLQKFKDAGLGIGNHTLSHVNAHTTSLASYIEQIKTADKVLTPFLTTPKYFRYPYLSMGDGTKKEAIQHYLSSTQYHIAPITIDSQDFVFNQLLLSVPEGSRRHFLEVLKPCYLDYLWQQTMRAEAMHHAKPQILLIHSNLLNAYVLGDIIDLYAQHGFNFISLTDALKS